MLLLILSMLNLLSIKLFFALFGNQLLGATNLKFKL